MNIPTFVLSRPRRVFLFILLITLSVVLLGLFHSGYKDVGVIVDTDSLDSEEYQAERYISLLDKRTAENRARSRAYAERALRELNIGKENVVTEETVTFVNDSPSQKPAAESGVKMADHSHHGFDAEKVHKLFCSCRGENDVISIDCYVDAYEELCKLFRLFGTIFSFVTSDVEEKIGILRDYRKEEHAEQYKTVQSMLSYEVANNLTKNKKKPSGSRTLLRLHRALEFISAFLLELKQADNNMKFSSQAVKAYDGSLAKHHPWLIKKAVHVAMYMIPTRPDLLRKMAVEDSEKGMAAIGELITELNVIFQITEKLYEKDNLLDLP